MCVDSKCIFRRGGSISISKNIKSKTTKPYPDFSIYHAVRIEAMKSCSSATGSSNSSFPWTTGAQVNRRDTLALLTNLKFCFSQDLKYLLWNVAKVYEEHLAKKHRFTNCCQAVDDFSSHSFEAPTGTFILSWRIGHLSWFHSRCSVENPPGRNELWRFKAPANFHVSWSLGNIRSLEILTFPAVALTNATKKMGWWSCYITFQEAAPGPMLLHTTLV